MYIDKPYYDDDYKGTPVEDVTEFDRLAKRASEQVDIMTSYTAARHPFDQLATFLQDQIKKATASIVEQYALNGGYDAVNGSNHSSVTIGSFSYSEGSDGSVKSNITSNAYDYLRPTGLLYRGVHTHD